MLLLSVPSFRFRGDDASLKCLYDLEGEQLYSVKWYKDGHEIFRCVSISVSVIDSSIFKMKADFF